MKDLDKNSITYYLLPINSSRGQTLIEVIIAVGLIVLVLTTLTAGLALGVRNTRFAKDRALSKEYVREAQEWLRNMRDQAGWETFVQIMDADTGTRTVTYCLDTLPASVALFDSALRNGACGSNNTIDARFTREVEIRFIGNPVSQIDATVTVSWADGAQVFDSNSVLHLYARR